MKDYWIVDPQGRLKKKLVPSKIVPTLRANTHGNLPLVLAFPKSTSTPRKFIKDTSQIIKTMEILPSCDGKNCQTLTCSLGEYLASRGASQEKEGVLMMKEEICGFNALKYLEQSNQSYSYLKMLKDFSPTMEVKAWKEYVKNCANRDMQ